MPDQPTTLTTKLTPAERSDLERCEKIIRRGQKAFIRVSEALMEIRDKQLYREHFSTFEKYCHKRWGFTARHGQRLLAANEVVNNLRPMGRIPENERQARPLVGLPAETQREVWQEAVETANDGKITAERVAELVEPIKAMPQSDTPSLPAETPAPDWAALLEPLSFYLTDPREHIVYGTSYFSHWEAARVAQKGIVPQRGAYIIKQPAFKDYRFVATRLTNDSTPEPATPLTAGDTPANEGQALHTAGVDDSTSPDEPTTPRHDPRAVSNAGEWTPGDKAYMNRAQSAVNHAHPGKMPYVGPSELERLRERVAELEAENADLRSENIRLKAEVVNLRNLAQLPDVKEPPIERMH